MSHTGEVNITLLRKMLRSKRERENLSLRDLAEAIGVSAPTLQRVEADQAPSTVNLLRIADWLGVDLDEIRKGHELAERQTVNQIEIHLRADPNLDSDAANTIADMVRQVYDGFIKSKEAKR